MDRMLLLRNPIQHYAWGSPGAIPALLGKSAASEPWAEMWMGAHASAPSRVEMDGAEVELDRVIESHAGEILGARVAGAFGRLPFLFKIIAAARPLSIQCHPDARTAREGFERENRLGVPLGARERNYRDASHKPELLVALGRFEALVGFRPPREIRERLDAAGARSLVEVVTSGGLAGFLASLLRLDREERGALLAEAADGLAGDDSREADWVRRLMADYPGDPAALAPLFLNLVELQEGEGLFLDAGVLHAYLGGVGLELMASSDNVLRGGLTEKHIDVAELLDVARFEPTAPDPLAPRAAAPGFSVYETPAAEFRLGLLDLASSELGLERERGEDGGPEIVLSLAERCQLLDAASGHVIHLERGSAALVTSQVDRYEVKWKEGRVYIADVP
jgi:mannose-6-phosphate isomerase